MDYEASAGLSRKQIRLIAKYFRKMFEIKTILFPVMMVLELLVNKFSNILYYSVEDDDDFELGVMAALVENVEGNESMYCIKIKNSVYDDAIKGDGASLGFICHEMCHFVLIHILGIGPKLYINTNGIAYTRVIEPRSLPLFKSMEWQAKALCGEVMIPYEKCKDHTLEQIVKETNSSVEQAKFFLKNVAKNE